MISFITDPKDDTTLTIDSHTVTVPQGKPIPMAKYSSSSFSQVWCKSIKSTILYYIHVPALWHHHQSILFCGQVYYYSIILFLFSP